MVSSVFGLLEETTENVHRTEHTHAANKSIQQIKGSLCKIPGNQHVKCVLVMK